MERRYDRSVRFSKNRSERAKKTRYWLSPEQLAERERARRRLLHLPEIFEGPLVTHKDILKTEIKAGIYETHKLRSA